MFLLRIMDHAALVAKIQKSGQLLRWLEYLQQWFTTDNLQITGGLQESQK